MSGSLLGRGRGGRLAVYAGCVAVVVLLVFAYRAAVSEMARLRDLHEQCSIHQESLQQRLQVIFDYKVRLEKSLADETSANAAVKQELQQRATREKSRRDKDTVEAIQRYDSLQQAHKILETERKDLQEECDKREKQALADTTRLETTLQGLRAELKEAREDKVQSLENLKSKYLKIDNDKRTLQAKYDELVKNNDAVNMQNQRLRKEVFQLNRELDRTKKSNPAPSLSSPSGVLGQSEKRTHRSEGREEAEGSVLAAGGPGSQNSINLARPPEPSEQQVSPPSKNEAENLPRPIAAPRDHRPISPSVKNDETLPNEVISDVGFEQERGGIIVPVGPVHPAADHKDDEVNLDNVLPIPYNLKKKEKNKDIEKEKEKYNDKDEDEDEENEKVADHIDPRKRRDDTAGRIESENVGDIPQKLALQAADKNSYRIDNNDNNVLAAPLPAEKSSSIKPGVGRDVPNIPIVRIQDEMQVLQEKLDGLDKLPLN